jgi:CrcB protein
VKALALVALGGAIGSVLRVALAGAMFRAAGASFPWGTLVVNVVGSLLIGVAAGRLPDRGAAWALIVPGLLGGFTTFSAFSLETLNLLRTGRPAAAILYALAAVTTGVAAAAAGLALVRRA